jgi:hypothetical protein
LKDILPSSCSCVQSWTPQQAEYVHQSQPGKHANSCHPMRQSMHLGNLKGCLMLCWKETRSFNCNCTTYDAIPDLRFSFLMMLPY